MLKKKEVKTLLERYKISYELDSKGENYKVKTCIFCGSSKSKLEVHVTNGYFKCWSCGVSGNFSKLEAKLEGKVFEDIARKQSKSSLTDKALKFHADISRTLEATQYLNARGFKVESINKFKLGVEKSEDKLWLTIPHFADGEVANIKYRSISSTSKDWKQERGGDKILFNQDVLNEYGKIIITEGELKTIGLNQVGVKNVVGLTGGVNNVPDEWIHQLRHKKLIYICMDSDQPGQKGAITLAKRIGLRKCRNILIPDAKDPDEYLFDRGRSKEDFLQLVKNAEEFQLEDCFTGLKSASDIKEEKVDFIWKYLLPLGKISTLDGNPGVGKSNLALAIASAISNGEHPWPIDMTFTPPSRDVLIFCGEDGAADTIIPRLKAQKADLASINIFDSYITFDEPGLQDIESMIDVQRPSLVIFDPITSFLGGKVDMNRANEMRVPMSKLAKIAEKYQCAVLLVRHLGKSSKDHAIYRGLGSIDTAAVARSMILVGKHPTDETLRVIVHIKSNLTKESPPLQFQLSNGVFKWAGRSDLTADDILYPNREAEQDKIEKAKNLLLGELRNGPIESNDLKNLAASQGISERSLERAKSILGIKSRRVGSSGSQGAGHYEWYLSSQGENH